MKIASIQRAIRDDETKDARVERAMRLVSGCAGADLVMLPEIWSTGYFSFDRYHDEAESIDGPTVSAAAELARRYREMGGSMRLRIPPGQGHNVWDGFFQCQELVENCVLQRDRQRETAATYRKIHLFGFGSDETKVLTPGTEVVTAPTDFGRVGLATCYDLRFPELFRLMVNQGAEFFLVCSAWPYPRLEHWLLLNRVRALENLAVLISSNCVGVNRGTRLCGHSQVVDPWGTPIAAAGDEETVVWAEVGPGVVTRVRDTFPPLRDRVLP